MPELSDISFKHPTVLEGQFGATIRNGNNWWEEVCGTISTATGDNVHSVVIKERDE